MKHRIKQYKNWRGDDRFEPQWWFLWWHSFECSYGCTIDFSTIEGAKDFLKPRDTSVTIHKVDF
jgi:hypothetical protein